MDMKLRPSDPSPPTAPRREAAQAQPAEPRALAPFVAVNLPGHRAAAVSMDNRVIRAGWPELQGPMFYPTVAVDVSGHRLRVLHDMGKDGFAIDSIDLRFDWPLDDRFTALQPYIMFGQSLAMNKGRDQSLTATPVAAGRALMYANDGPGAQMSASERPKYDKRDFGPCHYPASDLDRLVDLHEEAGESPVSAAVAGFLAALPDDTGVIATNHARGGMSMLRLLPKHLSEGQGHGIQYAGLLRAAVRTRQFCDAHARQMRQPIVSFIQGEAALPDDPQRYTDRLLALQAALTADLSRVTGQPGQVPVFTDQTRVILDPAQPLEDIAPPLAVAQLHTALAHPDRLTCVGPKYFLARRSTVKGRGDAVHLQAEASRLLGDYHGRAIRQTLSGQPWQPLHVARYHRDGKTIRLEVAGGDGSALSIDTTMVQQTLNSLHGFRWLQTGGAPCEITMLKLKGRTILLTLDQNPGTAGVDFARAALTIGFFADHPLIDEGPRTGGRTNIRDNAPEIAQDGTPMFNWLCHDWFFETDAT